MTELVKVGIIGRPNVGKSSIFNRLVGGRYCIVDSTAGVTRNCHIKQIQCHDASCLLMDTGGLSDDFIDDFTSIVQGQTQQAMNQMDIVLFVVDIFGLHHDDYQIASQVRKLGKPVLLLVNKCDNVSRDNLKTDFYHLGFQNLLSVSATHGSNFDSLKNWIYQQIKPPQDGLVEKEKSVSSDESSVIRLALIGKPNAGKSLLMNRIVKQERSLVSSIPGTTRDVVECPWNALGHEWLFLDTAGMRRRTKVHDNVEYYSIQRVIRTIEQSNMVIHLIDAVENVSNQDKKILDLCVTRKRPLLIVLNKWDLCQSEISWTQYLSRFRFQFPAIHYVPIIPISAKTGIGVKKLLNQAVSIFEKYRLSLKTSELNELIQDIQHKHTASQRRSLKIYYIVQTDIQPPSFLLFVNSEKWITVNLQRYLVNRIRTFFKLDGVPIQLTFREKPKRKSNFYSARISKS